MLQIGFRLSLSQHQPFIDFLMDKLDVFAWSASDLVNISPRIMTHHLAVKPTYPPPMRQKRKSFVLECNQVINKEVERLLQH